jgi:predicted enzyme related to lactoylglutathione lyase
MKNAIIPLFCTGQLDSTKAFYQQHLGFAVANEMPGYAELEQGGGGPRLAFMAPDDGKWKAASGQGLIYCFAVDDADAEHARLVNEGVTIVEAPGDKPWGERGFLAADPNGIGLYFGHTLEAAVESSGATK